ncbi:MAG: hypothetical protein VX777_06920 [Chlamydiota bacterium]|nr:hypothetical protein [Chlamydiota bacterium]
MKYNEQLIKQYNRERFALLKKFKLPNDQYAITGSGPIGIRNIRVIGDIDIIVTPELLDKLITQYKIIDEDGVKKIILLEGVVEAFWEGSFYCAPVDVEAPTIADRIKSAEVIDGLPFDSLENILYYKRRDARKKDLIDMLRLNAG